MLGFELKSSDLHSKHLSQRASLPRLCSQPPRDLNFPCFFFSLCASVTSSSRRSRHSFCECSKLTYPFSSYSENILLFLFHGSVLCLLTYFPVFPSQVPRGHKTLHCLKNGTGSHRFLMIIECFELVLPMLSLAKRCHGCRPLLTGSSNQARLCAYNLLLVVVILVAMCVILGISVLDFFLLV